MLIRRARITIERKENGWKKRREGRGGGEESWKDVDGGEREKERKRVLLHARRGGGNSFNFYRVRVYRRIVYVRISCIPDER